MFFSLYSHVFFASISFVFKKLLHLFKKYAILNLYICSMKGITMKFSLRHILTTIYRTICSACLFTVLMTTLLLFLASKAGWLEAPAISIHDYLTIMLVSLFIACANLLFKINRLPWIISLIIHYSVLLFALTTVFISSDKLFLDSSKSFVWVLIFTVIYAIVAVAALLTSRMLNRLLTKQKKKETTELKEDDYHSII